MINDSITFANNSSIIRRVEKNFKCDIFEIPPTVKEFSDYSCINLNVKEIKFDNITRIGFAAFECSSLEKIVITDSMKHLGNFCFADSNNLKEVIINFTSLENIGSDIFTNSNNIKSILLIGDKEKFSEIKGAEDFLKRYKSLIKFEPSIDALIIKSDSIENLIKNNNIEER